MRGTRSFADKPGGPATGRRRPVAGPPGLYIFCFVAPWRDLAARSEIALPKTRAGRYTPSSLVEHNRGAKNSGVNGDLRWTVVDGSRVCRQRCGMLQQPSSAVCWGLRECQHYPPSWVEATNSPGQVVSGSATPAGASQWNSCRTGSRAFAPGSRGYTRLVRGTRADATASSWRGGQTHSPRTGRIPGTPPPNSIQQFENLA